MVADNENDIDGDPDRELLTVGVAPDFVGVPIEPVRDGVPLEAEAEGEGLIVPIDAVDEPLCDALPDLECVPLPLADALSELLSDPDNDVVTLGSVGVFVGTRVNDEVGDTDGDGPVVVGVGPVKDGVMPVRVRLRVFPVAVGVPSVFDRVGQQPVRLGVGPLAVLVFGVKDQDGVPCDADGVMPDFVSVCFVRLSVAFDSVGVPTL